MIIDKRISELIVQKVRPEDRIVAAYLFGSYLEGACKESSDVDLAFLVDQAHYASDPVKAVSPAYMIAAHMYGVLKNHLADFDRFIIEIQQNFLDNSGS